MGKRRGRNEGTVFFWEAKGLWVGKITLPDGKRKAKYGKTQTEVKEWLLTQRNQLRQGLLARDDTVTFSEYLANYMENIGKHTLRPKTIEVYSYLIRVHIVPVVGRIQLSKLCPDHIQSLYSQN